jgi:hypothetical protein
MAVLKCGKCEHYDGEAKDEAGVSLRCTKRKLNVSKDSPSCAQFRAKKVPKK